MVELLMNIADGVIAASNVNVDQAKSIGEMIMQSMMRKNALECSLTKKDQAKTLGSKTKIKI